MQITAEKNTIHLKWKPSEDKDAAKAKAKLLSKGYKERSSTETSVVLVEPKENS